MYFIGTVANIETNHTVWFSYPDQALFNFLFIHCNDSSISCNVSIDNAKILTNESSAPITFCQNNLTRLSSNEILLSSNGVLLAFICDSTEPICLVGTQCCLPSVGTQSCLPSPTSTSIFSSFKFLSSLPISYFSSSLKLFSYSASLELYKTAAPSLNSKFISSLPHSSYTLSNITSLINITSSSPYTISNITSLINITSSSPYTLINITSSSSYTLSNITSLINITSTSSYTLINITSSSTLLPHPPIPTSTLLPSSTFILLSHSPIPSSTLLPHSPIPSLLPTDSPVMVCYPQTDVTERGRFEWPITLAGNVATIACPNGPNGVNASRGCSIFSNWEPPNVTLCATTSVTNGFMEISKVCYC